MGNSADVILIEDSPVLLRTRSIEHPSSDDVDLPDMPFTHTIRLAKPCDKLQHSLHTAISASVTASQCRDPARPTSAVPALRSSHTVASYKTISTGADITFIELDSSDLDEVSSPVVSQPIKRSKLSKSKTMPLDLSRQKESQPHLDLPRLPSHLLANIDKLLERKKDSGSKKAKLSAIADEFSDETENDSSVNRPKNRGKRTRDSTESSLSSQLKLQKKADKEEAKRLKNLEKEEKLNEKRRAQSIAAVNNLKKSKKDSTSEMIVEVSTTLARTALYTHLQSFMEGLGCTLQNASTSVDGLVCFRRHVKAVFDHDKGYWLPLETPRIENENQVILVMNAQEYVKLAATPGSLATHVSAVKAVRPSAKVLYLIEGLTALLRKWQTAKNRAFQAAVRANGMPSVEMEPQNRYSTSVVQALDEDAINDSLLDLQILHECFIVHSTSPADTAEQLSILTSDLSTVPYKLDRSPKFAAFCTENGQIKTGSDARDTFEKMLQAITRVTPQIAQAIAARYSGIRELATAIQHGPYVLENIPKGHNVDGTVTHQVIGPATAQRIYKALASEDRFAET